MHTTIINHMEIFIIFPLWLLVATLVLSMSCMFLFTLKSYRSPTSVSKLPPNPPKLPIIGNLHQLIGLPRHQALWKLSKQYGPLMQIHIGSKPFIVISSSTMAKQVFKNLDHIFCSRPPSHATKRLSYNYLDIAFAPHNDHWREMRKILVSEFLGPKRASSYNNVLVTEIKSMVHSLTLQPSNVAVNLNEVFLATVKGLVCKLAFGKNYREQPLKGPSWEVMLDETMEILNGSLGDSFPWLGRFIDQFSGWDSKLAKCFSNLDAYIETIVDEHQNNTVAKLSDDDDFVHTLVELPTIENASGYRLTKEDMKALIMDVLTGGIDTTVVTMVWAMSEITRSPRVMQKLQSEIRNCTGKIKKENKLDTTKMTYLKMVMKETLRLHPPAPLLLPHESLSHCQISGYSVFPRTTVLINAWAIGRDPETWGENAAEFYPERFENLEVEYGGGNCEMVPFGGGRRSCPAMNTVLTTMESTIANVLYWFDWEVPVGMKNEDLNMQEEGSLVARKKLPLYLIPKKYM
ncbi:putative cytochrome P450 [Helianthus annuus]|uniref:Cytochrome P450 n=2 Tax=Helianthus annuus TaxID=4232 RepID=A0A9K3NGF4_HELAN|nr:putative cytochrome P450 [Helianthus annuus]KAJ0550760.1 putative cytochrome P450 [Helianthus annuus]KAJ0557594.1 putative cytochrome P450 [Helianthus annuus]KAJ0563727.1 putative cytochrome P450 [Helianthus annuus]KAJ0729059.1 putative cytochrome P450 [Helianthus annuus]